MQIKFIWPINVFFLKETKSTNKFSKKYLDQILFYFKNWIIIKSEYQTNGKGQSGNWFSEYGKNLTFSLIFKPKKIYDSYIINIIISNAIHKFLSKKLNYPVWIKWPNDIIINNKKIGGILIENNFISKKIYISIVGIGINIKQKKFNKNWNSTSLKNIFNNINFDINHILYNITFFIQKEYLLFITNGKNIIKQYYIHYLYLKDKMSNFFSFKEKISFCGVIKSIDKKGFLLIEVNGKLKSFYQKEIKFFIKN
ncbi:biotin--[acetyl-CoA-carboxylase] ligase [Blattabacterium cuenoti]|uniref:biotin--[acetyl-CoA-carboxylase] ligase n=1 Tax=Blattabacterium cuenoti TaxID=1653831 RepID=UPI00163C847F|nr:biotin--[acetyl-CoA-carboxylase] ligase [Blattabacterium cuenoti]